MQLFAREELGGEVAAFAAIKGVDYTCLEWGETVRRRGGSHRQVHFYHINTKTKCSQKGKGLPHIYAQLRIQRLFPEGEVRLEVPFSTVGRIADCYHPPSRTVFEVQCSPITKEEVRARNGDYQLLGCRVIWILHKSRYGKGEVTPVEKELRGRNPYCFTNIDAQGAGFFYTEKGLVNLRKLRVRRLPAVIQWVKGCYFTFLQLLGGG